MTEPRERAERIVPATFRSVAELAEAGIGGREASRLVRTGSLIRLRRGRYARPDLDPDLLRAGRLGGRLDCVSLMSALGVFVRHCAQLHVQFTPGTTRLPPRGPDVVAHWRESPQPRGRLAADVIDALAQACRCQSPRDAIATLDSAVHCGLIDESGLSDVFHRLPQRFRALRPLVDGRCESGCETLVRRMLRSMGASVELQVRVTGVGRVDFVVDGWLIVECDSRAHHEGWAAQCRDRRRDMAAAALGYTTVRPLAEDILFRPETVMTDLARILAHGRRPSRRSSRPTPRNACR